MYREELGELRPPIRWEKEEYQDVEPVFPAEFGKHKKRVDLAEARIRIFFLAILACSAFTAVGLVILLYGLYHLHLSSILVGIVISACFIASGCFFDVMAEEEMDNVT